MLTLTYGAFVSKILRENRHKPIDEVNAQLDKMGFNIGTRIVDEFFAKSPAGRGLCKNFRETVDVIAKEGFKMFLGIQCDVVVIPQTQGPLSDSNPDGAQQREYSLVLRENPLSDFVVLPP